MFLVNNISIKILLSKHKSTGCEPDYCGVTKKAELIIQL